MALFQGPADLERMPRTAETVWRRVQVLDSGEASLGFPTSSCFGFEQFSPFFKPQFPQPYSLAARALGSMEGENSARAAGRANASLAPAPSVPLSSPSGTRQPFTD